MKIRKGDTELIYDKVAKCEDVNELKEILWINQGNYQEWKSFMNAVLEVNSLSYERLGKLCYCSKNTAKGWCVEGKLPQNREGFLKIALGLGLDLDQTNDLLQRFGRYPKLYAKNMEDAILIYVLTHPDFSRDPYEYYQELKENCMTILKKNKKKNKSQANVEVTHFYYEEILGQGSRDEFEQFIHQNIDIFDQSYNNLIEYIDLFIMSRSKNVHDFVQSKNLNPTFDKLISNLRNKREVPNRIKLIALGIHFNMTTEQLNKMLELAYMEPLCAKDKVECAVIYAIDNAHLNNPAYSYENAIQLKNYTNNAEIQRQCKDIIKNYLNTKTYERIGDANESNALDDEISEYVKWVLSEIELDTDEMFTLL